MQLLRELMILSIDSATHGNLGTEVMIKKETLTMVRKLYCMGLLIAAVLSLNPYLRAQSKSAYELLPDNTQAIVWVRNSDELIGSWDRTQLSKLASDETIRPFWEDQRQEIEKRFMDAGWRLNITAHDLEEIANGQFALAWIEKPGEPRKPFSLALIADVVDDPKLIEQMFQRLEKQLSDRGVQATKLSFDGENITKHSHKQSGELLIRETYYSVVNNLLLTTDDLPLIQDMISGVKGKPFKTPRLASDSVFVEARKQLMVTGKSQIEYFVRPLGFAKVLRAIGGKRTTGNTDILAVLQEEGFDSIRCICGEVELGNDAYDIHHRGFTLASMPLPKSAGVLDFPNKAKHEVPEFVGANASSLLVTNWNSQVAFWKTEGIVDKIVGQEGVFKEVIRGIKDDPTGPKIDIEKDVLPHFTNDIYSISDCVEPITVNSHRNLIALRIKEPQKLAGVLRRAMEGEPDTQLEMAGNQEIWKKVQSADDSPEALTQDFGDFGTNTPANGAAGGEDWLSSWAIAVHGDYFLFASHVELIKEAIQQAESGPSPMAQQGDFMRAQTALHAAFGEQPVSFWQIIRGDLSYKMQYELFRKGELEQSQSMLASILDRLLQNQSEIRRDTRQKLDGSKLPPFERIARYLKPSGMVVRTTDNGWSFGSVLLAETNPPAPNPTKDAEPESRISNTEKGPKTQ
jgi:hypothetical protein